MSRVADHTGLSDSSGFYAQALRTGALQEEVTNPMLRHLQSSTGGPIGRPHFEGSHVRPPTRKHSRRILTVGAAVVLLTAGLTVSVNSATSEILLGDATSFAVLAGTTMTNTGPSTVLGDIGVSPGDTNPGYDEMTHTGALHLADTAADNAQVDLITAYDDAAGRTPSTVATELGATTKGPGVYDSLAGTFGITGTLTLDADGDPDAFFIFQMGTTLITAPNSTVSLINGANACNVFWQVGSSATIDTGSTFKGTVMALTMIEVLANADIEGRLLAREAAVTLIDDTITLAECVAGAPTTGPTTKSSGAPAPTQSDTATLPQGPESLDPGTALFAVLIGIAAVALLLLRPKTPLKGRERDR